MVTGYPTRLRSEYLCGFESRRVLMSRSRKKHPIGSCGGYSEKRDKQEYSRGYRAREKAALNRKQYDMMPYRDGTRHGGNWFFNKDGKMWISEERQKEFPQWLRK